MKAMKSKETEEFLSLYKTYEGLLKTRGTDYKTVEEELNSDRMRMMRQMRNYLCHSEDPGFIEISPVCLKTLEIMVKEETLKGDIVKKHLVTPAKGSLKEGTMLSKAVYRMSILAMIGIHELPVYNEHTKRLKGIVLLERLAWEMDKHGNVPLSEETCGAYGKVIGSRILKPDELVPENRDSGYYFCTKDGTLDTQYMGYLDNQRG